MLGGNYFHFLPMSLLEGVTTLLLLLMHNAAFKHHFTLCLLRHYLQLVCLKADVDSANQPVGLSALRPASPRLASRTSHMFPGSGRPLRAPSSSTRPPTSRGRSRASRAPCAPCEPAPRAVARRSRAL